MIAENADNKRDKPLFLFESDRAIKTDLSRAIVGRFSHTEADRFFKFEDYITAEEYQLKIYTQSNNDTKNVFLPLIDSLSDVGIPVAITMVLQEDGYTYGAVSMDLYNPMDTRRKTIYSQELFGIIINRLKNATENSEEQNAHLPFLSGTEEIAVYFRTCRHTFPTWLVKAMEKELNTVNSTENTQEQRKHAKAALQYLANIDWGRKELNVRSVKEARRFLDSEFYGLESVKERILEIVAQVKRTGTLPVWGILLTGPAGTGKTSIAKAIATILNLPTIPLDLTTFGTNPEALAGSGRIYANGKPGHILDRMLEARSGSGVLLINEIEKSPARGKNEESGVADTLLTILDRHGFQENYLEVNIPTDGLFAVATCNDLERLSEPLKSRFYIISIPGYTAAQKRVIWRDYTLPKVTARYGLRPDQITLPGEAFDELIENYAVEPGVRDLERIAEKLCGALVVMLDEKGEEYHHKFTLRDIRCRLGAGKKKTHLFAINPGEINSIFYYEGSAHFYLLEASVVKGTGKFNVLGEVPPLQKDYIQVAYEFCNKTMSNALTQKDVTIFVATPLPEDVNNHVGCATFAALSSLMMDVELAIQNIAFIGGVDLNGNLYFDETDVVPLLRTIENSSITTIYAPPGVSEMIASFANKNSNITVIEAQNVQHLVSMAVATSRVN